MPNRTKHSKDNTILIYERFCAVLVISRNLLAPYTVTLSLFASLELGAVTPGSYKVKLMVDHHGLIDSVLLLAQFLFVNGNSTMVLYNELADPDVT